ncbi:TonB-dependent receptor [Bacteroides heparinolyticus]|uniref:TonB-dependent receptor n=1 Tax=Prevotella heparinolytica TaxID=28113 RepID=UPI0023F7E7AE|nr:TonB-dependent receptor [Bacteroides heparinolyticus]MCI6213221.1 TonB-dependent receptor [Bacteroides heparinolyticus]
MKITAILLVAALAVVNAANTYSQTITLSVEANNQAIQTVLDHIESLSEFKFFYNTKQVNTNKLVSIRASKKSVFEILDELFKNTNIKYEVLDKNIILTTSQNTVSNTDRAISQQDKNVSGVVTDQNGDPIIGANVMVKGTTNGTITDVDGNFTINNVSQSAILVVSYIGYVTKEIPVGRQQPLRIVLQEDQQTLDEVIVVGYGTMKKSDITGAIASVDKDKIARQPVANVSSALQGLATGVSVTSNSGSPGSASTIRIRGVGTVNDAEPLFVVDGMPVTDINYLSASDIQSMEILKDASASAIYGSRGANGVILITTKKGAVDKTTVTFDAYWGSSKLLNNLNLMSGTEWYDLQSEINKVKAEAGVAEMDLSLVDRNVSTNWMDEISRTAFMHNYSIGISGGKADDYKFNLGINYLNQEGTVKKTKYERINLRQSSEKAVIKNYLTVGTNLSISKSNSSGINEYSNSGLYDANYGVISNAIRVEPVVPAVKPDGTYGSSPYIDYYNPLADIVYTDQGDKSWTVIGNVYGELEIVKGLKFKSSFGAEIRRNEYKSFVPVYFVSNSQKNEESSLSKTHVNGNYYTFENTLTYIKTLAEKHSLNVLIGYTNEWGKRETLGLSGHDFIGEAPNLHYIDATLNKNKITGTNNATDYGLISYLGRLHYEFDNRYLLTASIRRDGSSKFSKDNRWGNFPSFALGWRIDNEKFFKSLNANWISSLKLRAGWGQIGNQNIGSYLDRSLLSLWAQYGALFGAGSNKTLYQGIAVRRLGNSNIKWETTESANVGIDASFLNNRLIFSFEYYDKTTKDMLLAAPMPKYMGYTDNTYTNIGAANNRGVELSMEWRDQINDFRYNIAFNFSTIRNRMTKLNGGTPIPSGVLRQQYATYTNEGLPIGAFWGYVTDGLIQTESQLAEVKKTGYLPNAELGDVYFVDMNEDGKLNENDKRMIGNPIPDVIYGFNLGMAWKGFDLSMQFGGTIGNDIFNAMRLYTYSLTDITNKDRALLNYWTPTNTNTNIPRLSAADYNNNNRLSDRYVENGSYLRLRNVQIGYTLPSSLVKKVMLQNVRIHLSGQNLFTISDYSGIDPEVGQSTSLSRGIDYGIYPQSRIITGGINITF